MTPLDAALADILRLREAGTAGQWRAERNIVHTDDGRSPRGELHTGSEADAKGVTLHNIMRQTRHKDIRVAQTYIRHATVFDSNATEGLGDDDED